MDALGIVTNFNVALIVNLSDYPRLVNPRIIIDNFQSEMESPAETGELCRTNWKLKTFISVSMTLESCKKLLLQNNR